MTPPSPDSSWLTQWRQYLADNDFFSKADDSLLLPESEPASPAVQMGRHLASATPDPAALLRKRFAESIRYDGLEPAKDASLHLAGAALPHLPRTINLKRGEIVQLDPAINAGWVRPVFVLILSLDGERVRIVPFGPVDLPASDGEITSELNETGLNVLCVWNHSTLPLRTFARHFKIDVAPSSLLADVEELLSVLQSGEKLPLPLAPRVGPSRFLFSPERQDYLDHEEQLFTSLATD